MVREARLNSMSKSKYLCKAMMIDRCKNTMQKICKDCTMHCTLIDRYEIILYCIGREQLLLTYLFPKSRDQSKKKVMTLSKQCNIDDVVSMTTWIFKFTLLNVVLILFNRFWFLNHKLFFMFFRLIYFTYWIVELVVVAVIVCSGIICSGIISIACVVGRTIARTSAVCKSFFGFLFSHFFSKSNT